jgi:phosphatidylglycerophosphate synthase
MLGRKFKTAASSLLRPAALRLHQAGLTPNQLTLVGFVLSAASAFSFALDRPRTGALLLLAAGFLDVLDGALARATGRTSSFGAYLDSVADRYAELAVFAGMALPLYRAADGLSLSVLGAAAAGSIMVSYTRARAESIIADCQIGWMERPERLIILIVFALAANLRPAFWIIAVGANLTALHRTIYTWRELRAGRGATAP